MSHWKNLESARELNMYWSKFFASPIERNWFQRPRFVKARSRSSASESCEAIDTRELDEILNMFSSDDILAILAFGDIEDALNKQFKQMKSLFLINLDHKSRLTRNLVWSSSRTHT